MILQSFYGLDWIVNSVCFNKVHLTNVCCYLGVLYDIGQPQHPTVLLRALTVKRLFQSKYRRNRGVNTVDVGTLTVTVFLL